MALNKNTSGFGLDLEARMAKGKVKPIEPAHTDAYEYTDTDINGYPYKKETKSKRLYLLAKPSVHQKLKQYAEAHGSSFNDLVHTLMEEFIDKHNL